MHVDHETSSVHTADEHSVDETHDADATFMTAPHAGRSSDVESSRESTPVPLRSEA